MAYTPTYNVTDLGNIAVDFAGKLMAGLAENGGVIGGLIVILIVIVLVIDLFTGVFGIFSFIRGKGR